MLVFSAVVSGNDKGVVRDVIAVDAMNCCFVVVVGTTWVAVPNSSAVSSSVVDNTVAPVNVVS